MADLYFHPELPESGPVELIPTEARHLVQVMRADIGQMVELFDGKGGLARAFITRITRKQTLLEVQSLTRPQAPQITDLTLAVSPPKGDRLNLLVEKLTELGVQKLQLLETSRTVVYPGETRKQKLDQVVIAACKQSRRLHLMEILPSCPLARLLEQTPREQKKILADPLGSPVMDFLKQQTSEEFHKQSWIGLVGPEGGFDSGELELMKQHGAQGVRLSPHILRVETAAIALAGLFAG